MKFEVYKDKKGEWRWRLKSRNGKIVAVGEGYRYKGGAIKAVRALVSNIKTKWIL